MITWADIANLSERSQNLRAEFENVKTFWTQGNYESARATYSSAVPQLNELMLDVAEAAKPPPYSLIIIGLVFALIIVVYVFARRWLKKKEEERKKKEQEAKKYKVPYGEEKYRTEYY